MSLSTILAEIDQELSRLQQARALLSVETVSQAPVKRRGRPKGSKNGVAPVAADKTVAEKVGITAVGRKKLADAMKKRWAAKRASQKSA